MLPPILYSIGSTACSVQIALTPISLMHSCDMLCFPVVTHTQFYTPPSSMSAKLWIPRLPASRVITTNRLLHSCSEEVIRFLVFTVRPSEPGSTCTISPAPGNRRCRQPSPHGGNVTERAVDHHPPKKPLCYSKTKQTT